MLDLVRKRRQFNGLLGVPAQSSCRKEESDTLFRLTLASGRSHWVIFSSKNGTLQSILSFLLKVIPKVRWNCSNKLNCPQTAKLQNIGAFKTKPISLDSDIF